MKLLATLGAAAVLLAAGIVAVIWRSETWIEQGGRWER